MKGSTLKKPAADTIESRIQRTLLPRDRMETMGFWSGDTSPESFQPGKADMGMMNSGGEGFS